MKKLFALFFCFVASGVAHAGVISTRTTAPTTCAVGDVWINPGAATNDRIYTCTSINTWTKNSGRPWVIQATAPSDLSLIWFDNDQVPGYLVLKLHNGTAWVEQAMGEGSGVTYTAGTGIDITDGVISSTVTGTLPSGAEGQVPQKGVSAWEAVDLAPLAFTDNVSRNTTTGVVSVPVTPTATSGSTTPFTSGGAYTALAGKEDADSTIVKVAEIDTQAEFEALVGWLLPSGGTGGYVSLSAAPYSDVACTTGNYGYYGSTAYLCTDGFWTSKWELTTHTNASPTNTALIRWDGGDTAGSQTNLNVFQEASGAITATGVDFSTTGVGDTGHSAEVLNGDTVNFACTDGVSIDLAQGQIDMHYSRSAAPEAYGTFLMLGTGANDFRLLWYSAPGDAVQFRYGDNRYSWPVPSGVCPFTIGTFYKITLIWDIAGADPILKINDAVVTGGSWVQGTDYGVKPTISSPIMYILTDNAGDYQPFGRVDDLAIYPVAQ